MPNKSWVKYFTLITTSFIVSSCASAQGNQIFPSASSTPTTTPPRVIVISIDGLRPDAIEKANATALMELQRSGAYSLNAHTILPSITLPSHTSMVTGVGIDRHKVTWNRDHLAEKGTVNVPTMFEIAKEKGLTTAAFFGKSKLRHFAKENTLSHLSSPTGSNWKADRVSDNVAEYLESNKPHLTFVHLPDPDMAGHKFGWMSLPYRMAVRNADEAVTQIWNSAKRAFGDNYVIIITADHGGKGHSHGKNTSEDRNIPWVAWGQGIKKGEVEERIDTFDTAATALWILGINPPKDWDGQPITDVYSTPVQP